MKNVTCYGTGLIGSAWVVVFLRGNCKVSVYDISEDALKKADETVRSAFNFFLDKQLMTQEQIDSCLANVTYTTDPETAVRDADFIQESGPERLDLKQNILATIEQYCSPETIICSSTSGIPISNVAENAVHKGRIIGAHPYNPVYLIPLVEISKGKYAEQKYVDEAKTFYECLGKEVVVLNKDCPGFICNRIQAAVLRECYDLSMRGVATVEDIDKALTYSLGLRWGIIGIHLTNELASRDGIKGLIRNYRGPFADWLSDLATWTVIPEEYEEKAVAGVRESMAHRLPGTGNNRDELLDYMNNGIIELLKYHGKL